MAGSDIYSQMLFIKGGGERGLGCGSETVTHRDVCEILSLFSVPLLFYPVFAN